MDTIDIEYTTDTNKTLFINVKDERDDYVDITGATVYFTVKEEYDTDPTDSNAIISIDVTSHTSPTLGKTEIEIPPTSPVNTTDCLYDIMLKFPSGDKKQISYGFFKFIN